MNPAVLIIAGPTAAGKKTLALRAAERFDGEIVSADSRKVYRLLDIGTAKPSPEDRARIPHHLVDIVDPDEPFSAGEWVRRASDAVRDIITRGKLPIISGGTGFYIEAFMHGLSAGISPDSEVRAAIGRELAELGPEALYEELRATDPARAAELHPNDTVRILRALEILRSTGLRRAEIAARERMTGGEYVFIPLAVGMEREALYRRIDDRVDGMVRAGLLDELRDVLEKGYARGLVSLDTVGYREWYAFLDGAESFDFCLDAVKRNTRRYAKRQLTWFRNHPGYVWIDGAADGAVDEVERLLRRAKNP